MEFINWDRDQGRKSEIFKGSTCSPTLGSPKRYNLFKVYYIFSLARDWSKHVT